MDTSKEYIEMCQIAKEIQHKVHRSLDGCSFGSAHDFWGHSKQKDKMVWLPRQDQLQAMVSSDNVVNWRFYMFANDGLSTRLDPFKTMEQLWLAFVMHEKYDKRWDGSEWVIE